VITSVTNDGVTPTATMADSRPDPGVEQLRSLMHRLNNQLGVILAHAELLETKAGDELQRARATQVVTAALQAMSLAREIRSTMSGDEA
jgi:two-component sensor histidine kinase